jgi:hypothetical protein
MNQPRSISGGPTEAISQSSTADGSKSSNSMLPMRASPHSTTGGASGASADSGQCASSQSNARSITP